MTFKKMFLNLSIALSLVIGANMVTAPRAHAYLLLEGLNGATPSDGPWHDGFLVAASAVGACIVLLPVCLLDEESNGSANVTAAHLAANGYSQTEIALIMADQAKTAAALKANHAILQIRGEDTRESIAGDILSVNPEASDTYINFINDSAGL